MASQSEKKQTRKMQAAHPGIAHADALRRVRDGKAPVYGLQLGEMENGTLPYPMLAEADGTVRRQPMWAGVHDRAVGFLPTNDRQDRTGSLLRWDEYATGGDPQRAVGMYLVSASPSDQWSTHSTPIIEVEIHDLPALDRGGVAEFNQAIRDAEEVRRPVPNRVVWEPHEGGYRAVFYAADWRGTQPGVVDLRLQVSGVLGKGIRPGADTRPELYTLSFQRGDTEEPFAFEDHYVTLADAYLHASGLAEDLRDEGAHAEDDRWIRYWREEARVLDARMAASEAAVELDVSTDLPDHTWPDFEAVCHEIDEYRNSSDLGGFTTPLDVFRITEDTEDTEDTEEVDPMSGSARFEVQGPTEVIERLARVLPSRGYTLSAVTVTSGDVNARPAAVVTLETVAFTVVSAQEHRFDEGWRSTLAAQMALYPTVQVADIGGGAGGGVSDHDFEAVGGRADIEMMLDHLRGRYDRVQVWQDQS